MIAQNGNRERENRIWIFQFRSNIAADDVVAYALFHDRHRGGERGDNNRVSPAVPGKYPALGIAITQSREFTRSLFLSKFRPIQAAQSRGRQHETPYCRR